MTLANKLQEDYNKIFRKNWPVWVGGLCIGIINVFLFIYYQPWTTLDGVLNWGDWILSSAGVITASPLPALLRSGSVINIGLLVGAFLSALLAGQFGIRIGPGRELLKGLIGGLLIGFGAVLVRGCNIGGFFSGTSAMGMQGLGMAAGLMAGAFVGARFLVWEIYNLPTVEGQGDSKRSSLLSNPKRQPIVGVVVLVALIWGGIAYVQAGYPDRATILFFGVVLGVVSQRSRICFVRAFREPFLTGEATHTKAMLLSLAISVIGFTIVKYVMFERVDEFVRSTFWLGSVVGGVIFGFGMTIAGGCGGGTIWRVGEGHVKLWMALVGYILSASYFNEQLINSGLIDKLGEAVFLPDVIGWGWAVISMLLIIFVWYLFAQWNEITRRFVTI